MCLLLLSIFPPRLVAQENDLKFDRLSIEEGLSQSSVFSIAQDKRGMMWFGTWDGLNRYDGYQFTTYKYQPLNPNSLSNNEVRALHEDAEGVLWVGTMDGLCRFDRNKEHFIRYRHDPSNLLSLGGNKVQAIVEDRNAGLWVGTEDGGLSRFDRDTGQFTRYQHDPEDPESISHNDVRALCVDRQGMVWVGTWGGGLNLFDPNAERFTLHKHSPNSPTSLGDDFVQAVYEDEQGTVWVGTASGGLSRLEQGSRRFTNYLPEPSNPFSLSDKDVISIYETRGGELWIGTRGGGLNRFDRNTRQFLHYQPIDGNNVWSLYEDLSGILWIGTSEGGVNRVLPNLKNFVHYQHDPGNSTSLSGNDVWSILEGSDGVLWIGLWDHGLNRLDPQTGAFTQFMPDPEDSDSLSQQDVIEILEDHEGTLWVGTTEGGLNKFDDQTGRFTRYSNDPDDPQSLAHDFVFAMYEDRQQVLWVGDYLGRGLSRFDRKTETFTHIVHDPENPHGIGNYKIKTLYEDSMGYLWMTTDSGGLGSYDRDTGRFTYYAHDPTDLRTISHNSTTDIHEDRQGRLWIATWGGGLNRFDRETETFKAYREEDGLPSNAVMGILEDDESADGELWLSTFRGISRFNPQTEIFKNYTPKDGLQSYEFNNTVAFKSRDGRMYFGGINGFNSFYPSEIRDNPYIPPVILTDLEIFNSSVPIGDDSFLKKSIIESSDISLSYRESVFTFEFAALSYQFPEKNRYRYKLEGFDDDWREVDSTRRFATYTHIDPGRYTFRVVGSNNDGVWNEDGVSISITVTPPWWETWWFRGFLLLLVVGLVLSGHRWRVKAIEDRGRTLESLVIKRTHELAEAKAAAEAANRSKSEFLANMSHEIRTPMNAILGFADVLRTIETDEQKSQYADHIHASGKSLLSLIDDILDLSKIEAGKLELRYAALSMESLAGGLRLIFDQTVAEKGLDFLIDLDEQLPVALMLDEGRLRQVLLNLLGNAVKFTDVGHVRLAVTSTRRDAGSQRRVDLLFEVEDTGVGIPPDAQQRIFESFEQTKGRESADRGVADRGVADRGGTGLGLAISRRLVGLMGGDISVESSGHGGSIFRVRLPDVEVAAVEPEGSGRGGGLIFEDVRFDPATIVIADDRDYNRTMLTAYMAGWPFTIHEAANGKEALEKAHRYRPDLILLDMRMPVMDGFRAAELIRQDPNLRTVPIVAVTASALKDEEERVSTYCDGYLRKPVGRSDLVAQLMRFLPYTPRVGAAVKDLTTEALMALPTEWLHTFSRAVNGADTDECLSLTHALPPEFASVTVALESMVRSYRFDRLIKLVSGSISDSHDGTKETI